MTSDLLAGAKYDCPDRASHRVFEKRAVRCKADFAAARPTLLTARRVRERAAGGRQRTTRFSKTLYRA
jgi:hypothetical protein